MSVPAQPRPHGPLIIALHWIIAVLFLAAFILGEIMEEVPRGDARLTVMGWHLLAGSAIFALFLPRLLTRFFGRWTSDGAGPDWARRGATLVYAAFYGLMIALPFTGFFAIASGRSPVPLWGNIELNPFLDLHFLHEAMEETHEFLVSLLIAVVAAHVAGVLWHKFVRRDGVWERMWPFGSHHAG